MHSSTVMIYSMKTPFKDNLYNGAIHKSGILIKKVFYFKSKESRMYAQTRGYLQKARVPYTAIFSKYYNCFFSFLHIILYYAT